MGDMLGLDDKNAGVSGLRVRTGKSGGSQVLEFQWTRALRIVVGRLTGVHISDYTHTQNIWKTQTTLRENPNGSQLRELVLNQLGDEP